MNAKVSRFVRLILIFPFAIPMSDKLVNYLAEVPEVWAYDLIPFTLTAFAIYILLVLFSATVFRIIRLVGNMLCGLLSGYRFGVLQMWNLAWVRNGERIRFLWIPGRQKGCSCLMFPPAMVNGKFPFMLHNFGGLIFSGIIGFILLMISSELSTAPFLSVVVYFVAALCILFVLTEIVPMDSGKGPNPGYIALELSRDPRAFHAKWAELKILEAYSHDTPMKDMPAEWFHIPTRGEMENRRLAHRGVLACMRMMSEQKFEDADRLAEYLLPFDSIRGVHRNYLTDMRIYRELIGENRSEALDALLTPKYKAQAWDNKKNSASSLVAKYAYALLHEQDTAKAEAINAQFEKQAGISFFPGDEKDDRALMEYARRVADERRASLLP